MDKSAVLLFVRANSLSLCILVPLSQASSLDFFHSSKIAVFGKLNLKNPTTERDIKRKQDLKNLFEITSDKEFD